jgi:1-phosphatidylinositol phosphodiesterase
MRTTFHLAGLLLLTLIAMGPAAQADDTRSYNRSSTIETWHPNWMRWVPDSKLLSDLSLPGTHDTMALYGGDLVETQSLPLRSQLDAGIRVLDIRCRHIEDVFAIHHGVVFQNAYFGADVLKVCYEFLQDNPTETILMRVGDAGVPEEKDCTSDYEETFQWYRDSTTYGSCIFIDPSGYDTIHALGVVRGKVVIFDEFDGGDWGYNLFGDDTDLLAMQAEYDLNTIFDRDDKWEIVRDFFRYTDGDASTFTPWEGNTHNRPAEPGRFYINWTSATSFNGGVYPNAIAVYVNPRTLEYLFDRNQNRTAGIVWMDFPGAGLIDAIIAHNLKYATNASDRSVFKASFDKIFSNTCYSLNDGDYDDSSLTERATALQFWLGHILPWRGAGFNVRDHWSVVVKDGDRGFENWAVVSGETSGQSLFEQSDWIDDRSYVAMNAVSRATSVTTNDLSSYLISGGPLNLTPALVTAMNAAGDCLGRASALKSLVSAQFPTVNWNVAISRNAGLGIALDTRAFCIASAPSSSDVYFYYVWAGSVRDNNILPVPNAGGPYTIGEGGTGYYLTFDSSRSDDPDNSGVPTYFWDFDNDGVWDTGTTSTNMTAQGRFASLFSNRGTYTVRMGMWDGVGSFDQKTVITTTTVTVTNIPPKLNLGTSVEDMVAGTSLFRQGSFSDPGQNPWTVNVKYGDGTPAGPISFSEFKAFQLNHLYSTAGNYTVTVTVNDGMATAEATFLVRVLPAGERRLSLTGTASAVGEGSPVTLNADFYYPGWEDPLNDHSILIDWGDGTQTQDPLLAYPSAGRYTFSVQHPYQQSSESNYVATVYFGNWTSRSFPVTVTNVPPAIASLTFPGAVEEGVPFYLTYSIADPGREARLIRVDWGDGTQSVEPDTTLTGNFDEPHRYPGVGTYLMTVRVTDDDGATSVATNSIRVVDEVPEIFEFYSTTEAAPEGGPATVEGEFESYNFSNDHLTVEIDWGDGRPPTPATFYQNFGEEEGRTYFNASHLYNDNNGANPWTPTVRVTDDDGNVATRSTTLLVTNLPPVVDAVPNFSIPEGSALTRSGNITDPGSDSFTGTVNYGDGTGTQALSIIGNSYQLNHTYAANDTYTITVNVTDDDGASASRTMKVLVGPVRDLLVTNTNDAGPGSLRQAVLDANMASPNSTSFPNAYADIRFAPGLSGQTITLTSGQLVSCLRTRIDASSLAAGIKVSGNNASRVLEVAAGNSVVLDSLTIMNGRVTGGIPNNGGGVLCRGNLIMNRCTLSGNRSDISGGALFVGSGGSATLNECTVGGNQSLLSVGGGISSGGTLILNQCTVSGNSAGANAGGIVSSFGTLALNHCTVSGNSSFSPGGLSVANGVSCTVANSIIAGNSGNSIAGTVTYLGANLTSGDPMLFPLGNYGGPTATMPPRPGSPVIDAVSSVSLAVLTTPLAFWRLGEDDPAAANGTTVTTSSNQSGGALTFNGPATYDSAVSPVAAGWLDSRLGVSFAAGSSGTCGLVAGLDGSTAITDNFGIELWVKPNDTTGTKCLAYNGHTGTSGWGLYQFGANYGALFGGVIIFGSGPATAGVWTHLALVRDNGTATLYVNGVASGTVPDSPNVPAGRFAAGAQPQTLAAEFFAGALDEVRVFTFAPGQFSPNSLSYQPTESLGYSHPPSESDESLFDSAWSLDQRGYPRVANGAADIGAVEVQQSVVRVTDNAGVGSLRQALADVDASGIVTFAPALSGQTITLTSGQLTLSKNITIDASSLPCGIQVSGNNSSRVMEIAANNTVTLDSLTLKNGRATGADFGGGILIGNGAVVTVNRSTISGNVAAAGGGIYCNQATLTVNSSTLSGNHASGFLAGGYGGGLYAYNSTVPINQSTISGNTFTPGFNSGSGGGIATYGSSVTVQNSIVAGNSTPDIGTLNGASPSGPNNIAGGNPLLAPLGNYGGPTATMPPLPGSPAIDGCTGGTSCTTDQRGRPRWSEPSLTSAPWKACSIPRSRW